MGQVISSLCGEKEKEDTTKNASPPKQPVSEQQTKKESPVKKAHPQEAIPTEKQIEQTSSKLENHAEQTSESGSSSHITINDFTWLKVAVVNSVSR